MSPKPTYAVAMLLCAGACSGPSTLDSTLNPDSTPTAGGIDVSITVSDTGDLPTDTAALFRVSVRPSEGGDEVAWAEMEVGETSRIELDPGEWRVSGSFSWDDPSQRDTNTQDTGGYVGTECYGSTDVTVEAGEIASTTVQAECSNYYLD